MTDLILIGVMAVILGAAAVYIVKAKKRGAKCIGCPSSGQCSGNKKAHSGCGCGCHTDTDKPFRFL